jgi:hypothetical protein
VAGTIVGIACGTSITLFVDLAMYIMRMNLSRLGRDKKEGRKLGPYKLFANEEFHYLTNPKFKLILFSSFKTREHVLCELLLRAAQDISDHSEHHNFQYHLRISNEKDQPNWDPAFFAKHIPSTVKKVFITGPLGAESTLTRTLIRAGFNKSLMSHL